MWQTFQEVPIHYSNSPSYWEIRNCGKGMFGQALYIGWNLKQKDLPQSLRHRSTEALFLRKIYHSCKQRAWIAGVIHKWQLWPSLFLSHTRPNNIWRQPCSNSWQTSPPHSAIWSMLPFSLHKLPTHLVSVSGPQILIPGQWKQLQTAWIHGAGGKSLICSRAEGILLWRCFRPYLHS